MVQLPGMINEKYKSETGLNLEKIGFPLGSKIFQPASAELWKSINLKNTFSDLSERQLDRFQGEISTRKKISNLLSEEKLTIEKTEELYELLSDFISEDINHGRIILYLPFNLLDGQENSSNSYKKFTNSYKSAWLRLLHESEPRASFVDGDVLEPGMQEPELVRKAAHLIPELFNKKIISEKELHSLVRAVDDTELLFSVLDGVQAAYKLRYIKKSFLDEILEILNKKGVVLSSEKSQEMHGLELDNQKSTLIDVFTEMKASLKRTNLKHTMENLNVSQKRVDWQKQVKTSEILENSARQLVSFFQYDKLAISEMDNFLSSSENIDLRENLVSRSLFSTLEVMAIGNINESKHALEHYLPLIESLWSRGDGEIRNIIISGMSHLHKLGVIEDDILNKFKIFIPDLSSVFPTKLETLASGETSFLINAAKKIENHPQLSRFFYPCFLIFGSRVKGYATGGADLDAAIFIRPEIGWEQRLEILELLYLEIPELKQIDKILEFWIDESEGGYSFKTNKDIPMAIGAPYIHFLMGGVWVGCGNEMKDIYTGISQKYFDLSKFGEQKEQARLQLLRQLELDALQYRLMHKGYEKYYPRLGSAEVSQCSSIDGKSAFWDSGYREVATQLFLKRVFVPDLSE